MGSDPAEIEDLYGKWDALAARYNLTRSEFIRAILQGKLIVRRNRSFRAPDQRRKVAPKEHVWVGRLLASQSDKQMERPD